MCLIMPKFLLALMIFSLRCFSKDRPVSSIRPKCFCSFNFATIDRAVMGEVCYTIRGELIRLSVSYAFLDAESDFRW